MNERYARLGFAADEGAYMPDSELETILRLAQIKKLVAPLGIDVRNWSMILHGGYLYENGEGSSAAGGTFAQAMEQPFLRAFFAQDQRLKELIAYRRDRTGREEWKIRATTDEEICRHLTPGR